MKSISETPAIAVQAAMQSSAADASANRHVASQNPPLANQRRCVDGGQQDWLTGQRHTLSSPSLTPCAGGGSSADR